MPETIVEDFDVEIGLRALQEFWGLFVKDWPQVMARAALHELARDSKAPKDTMEKLYFSAFDLMSAHDHAIHPKDEYAAIEGLGYSPTFEGLMAYFEKSYNAIRTRS